ncbi:hypothetical protein vseg_010657 [Gypsophila vaccaria]
MSSVLDSSRLSDIYFISFFPPKDDIVPSRIHLAIQVNVFTCGGFALARYHTHKVTDGISSATFWRHWSALVTTRYEDAAHAEPDFNASVSAFPPLVEEESPPVAVVTPALDQEGEAKEDKKQYSRNFTFEKIIVTRSFLFKDDAINELKAKSISEEVAYPSRFEAVSSFLWKRLVLGSPEEGHSILAIPIYLRPKTDPPLPCGSIGNLLATAFLRANNRTELRDMFSEILKSISQIKDVAQELQVEKRPEEYKRILREFVNAVIECKGKDIHFVNSLCNSVRFNDVDFGFGKPKWVVPFDDAVNKKKGMALFSQSLQIQMVTVLKRGCSWRRIALSFWNRTLNFLLLLPLTSNYVP